MNFKVHLSLIHRAFTDRTISEHTFLLKYIPETENRDPITRTAWRVKMFIREEK